MTDVAKKIEGLAKEGAGYVKEEHYEHKTDAESQAKAQEGRDLRNEGKVLQGEAPKLGKPGAEHPEKDEN